jgi:hypothetical protein
MFSATMTINTAKIDAIKTAFGPDALMAQGGPIYAAAEWTARDGMPAYFMSTGEGTWPPVKRGGTPLMLTGKLLAGFTFTTDGDKFRITTTGKPANIVGILNNGGTIKPKAESHTVTRHGKSFTVKNYLHFKVGDQWVKRLSVTIPPRPWNRWTEMLLTGAGKAATRALKRIFGSEA